MDLERHQVARSLPVSRDIADRFVPPYRLTAVVSIFRNMTFKHIWSGFCNVLRTVFVDSHIMIRAWIQKFGGMSYHVMKALGGPAGMVLWTLGRDLVELIAYVLEKPGLLYPVLVDQRLRVGTRSWFGSTRRNELMATGTQAWQHRPSPTLTALYDFYRISRLINRGCSICNRGIGARTASLHIYAHFAGAKNHYLKR